MSALIPGYTHDDADLAPSPVTSADLDALLSSVLFGPEDQEALRTAAGVLEGQVEDILDVWYGFVGAHPHLIAYFATPDGEPIGEYLTRVRARFGQWIIDTCTRPYDERWLAYQQEIALRHTEAKKNRTDGADSVAHIPLRYVIAFIYPITATMRPFLAAGDIRRQRSMRCSRPGSRRSRCRSRCGRSRTPGHGGDKNSGP